MSPARKPRRNARPSGEYADKSRGERLQRVLADAGVASRRECEELVLGGAVTVNGKVVDTLPAWVDPGTDKIEVYGRPLRKPEKHVYIMLFKPRGTVCTNSDPEGRPLAIDLVRHPERPRLYCVGRLDLDSSGLLILTNDGDFANRLTHPRYLVAKGYDLTLDGRLDERAIAELERTIFAADRGSGSKNTQSSLRLVGRDGDKTVVHLTLCEHRNLQVRPLMLELGHPVKKLRRTSFGPLKLKGLAVGEWRELTRREVDQLMQSARGEDSSAARAPRAPRRSMEELAVAREARAAELAASQPPPTESPDASAPKTRAQREARPPRGGKSDGPRASKSAFGKPAAGKPGFAKPGFGKPGFAKPGFGKPGFGKPGTGNPRASKDGAREESGRRTGGDARARTSDGFGARRGERGQIDRGGRPRGESSRASGGKSGTGGKSDMGGKSGMGGKRGFGSKSGKGGRPQRRPQR